MRAKQRDQARIAAADRKAKLEAQRRSARQRERQRRKGQV